jgi:hypothetical protein
LDLLREIHYESLASVLNCSLLVYELPSEINASLIRQFWRFGHTIFRFPRFCRFASFSVRVRFWFVMFASDLIPSEAFADNLRSGQLEAVEVKSSK